MNGISFEHLRKAFAKVIDINKLKRNKSQRYVDRGKYTLAECTRKQIFKFELKTDIFGARLKA